KPVDGGAETVGVARFGEKLAGLLRVVGVLGQVSSVTKVGRRQVGVCRSGETAPDDLGDDVAVDGVVQGLAHAHIVERLHTGVDVDAVGRRRGDLTGRDVGVGS